MRNVRWVSILIVYVSVDNNRLFNVNVSVQEWTVIQFVNEFIQLRDGYLAPNEWSQPPKLRSLSSQERVKLQTSNLAHTFKGESEQKPFTILEKRERGRIQGLPKFLVPSYSGTGKAMNFKFCMHIGSVSLNKSPLKISRKIAVGVLRDSRKFSGHFASRGHLCNSSVFLYSMAARRLWLLLWIRPWVVDFAHWEND